MRIAHISTQRGWHGGEQQARLLVEGLAERGHESLILGRCGGEFARRMRSAGHQVVPLSGSGRNPLAMWQIRRQLALWRPDVVHFHDPHALSSGGLAICGLPIRARVVARRVDFPIHSPWRYRCWADRVIAVSNAVAQVCRASGLAADRVVVVHDGVDPRRVSAGNRNLGRQTLGIADHQRLLLTVATLTDHKGHTFLLQAMPQVRAGHPEAVLVLAGDGELRAPLAAEAARLGLGESVRFVGYREDVPDLLLAADLFVLPSHLEGLGSSLIDVMFARRPIVTTTAGGIPDLVGRRGQDDQAVALLVPPRDPAALANAICTALADPAALISLVDRAELRARSEFSDQRMVEGTLAVYEQLLSAGGSRPADSRVGQAAVRPQP